MLVISCLARGYGHEALRTTGLKRATACQRVWFIRHPSPMDGLAMHAIALIVVHLGHRCVDRDLMKIGAAQPGDLGVHIRVNTPREQGVV